MSNFRNKKVNFSQISNTVLWDKRLSMQAKGLYCEIIDCKTNQGIKLTKSYLISKGIEAKEEVEGMLNELQDFGLITVSDEIIELLEVGI